MALNRNLEANEGNRASYAALLASQRHTEAATFDDSTFETVWLRTRKTALFRTILNEFVKKNVFVYSANGWPQDAENVQDAVRALAIEIRSGTGTSNSPSWVFVACSETLDPREVLSSVKDTFPNTANIHCITSCQGVTTDVGFKSTSCNDGVVRALSMFTVFDPLGAFSTIAVRPPEDPSAITVFDKTLDQAYLKLRESALDVLKDPSNDGKKVPGPEPLAEHLNIWMSGLPGTEEKTLEALYEWGHQRFNRTIPVVGGTGADAGLEGKWRCFCQQADGVQVIFGQDMGQGVILTLVAASVKVFPCFMHPFTPMTEFTMKVVSCGSVPEENTGETMGRVIHTFRDPDGNEVAAGTLYHKLCEEQIQKKLMPPPLEADGPGAFNPGVLAASTACPLGVPVAREGDDAYDYRMMHPSGIYFKKGHEKTQGDAYLKNFASVETGKTDVVLFKASRGDLLGRLTKLKEQLVQQIDRASGGSSVNSVALSSDALRARLSGVLMVYCAGCMMAVNSGKDGAEQMRRLTTTLSNCFAGRPFLAYHPFGEQGFFPSKQVNHHSNLMFSALCFSKDPCFEMDESRSFSEMLAPIIAMFEVSDSSGLLTQELQDLIASGENASFQRIATMVRGGMMTPGLLQEMTACSSQPLTFALKSAEMFHTMAKKFPLKATEYHMASAWFKDFCRDFLGVAPMHLLAKGNVLDYPTIKLAVLMAVKIDSKGLVASNHFQELMDEIWTVSPDPQKAMEQLLTGSDRSIWTHSPMVRHYTNVASYCCLTLLQFYTTHYSTSSATMWGAILLWSFSNAVQTLASPATGFYTYITTLDDLAIVAAHVSIFYQVYHGNDVPRDLDALTMVLHFGNILKGIIVNAKLGPWVIMVMTMMGDIQQFLVLLVFFLFTFYCSYHALFRDVTGVYVGEKWSSATTLLINAIWGPQVIWESEGREDSSSLFLSWISGMADSSALDVMGGIVTLIAVFTVPILLLNLLIAMMASSYQEVSTNVDSEYKRSFASCVLVARELPFLPMPFSLPVDLGRCILKWTAGCKEWHLAKSRGRRSETLEELEPDTLAKQQLVVSQILSLWEARSSIERFKEIVTVEQVERMRSQNDGLQDRVNVLYNTVLNMAEKQDKMEVHLMSLMSLISKK